MNSHMATTFTQLNFRAEIKSSLKKAKPSLQGIAGKLGISKLEENPVNSSFYPFLFCNKETPFIRP